ncbi:MAG: hypothetical protein MAG453_00358 [Calditrichaeota bacterium]|nr:hypothetical protein [Calditrichota bacterium]
MRCAVVGGTGWQGAGIATRIAAAGWTAVIGSRDMGRAQILRENLPPFVGLPAERFDAATNVDAVKDAEVVFITVPSTGHRAALESIRKHLDDEQLIIDVTAPVDPDNHLNEIWPEAGSYTAEAQELLGEEYLVCGAFKNVSATMLLNHRMPPNCDICICGDERDLLHPRRGSRRVHRDPEGDVAQVVAPAGGRMCHPERPHVCLCGGEGSTSRNHHGPVFNITHARTTA